MELANAQALHDTFSLGLMLGDPVLMSSVYAPGAILVPSDGTPRNSRADIDAFWRSVLAGGVLGNTSVTEELDISGDWMLERGVYARFPAPVALSAPVERGRFSILLERQPDGRWLWARDVLVETQPFP